MPGKRVTERMRSAHSARAIGVRLDRRNRFRLELPSNHGASGFILRSGRICEIAVANSPIQSLDSTDRGTQ